ncbi:hypothetical protein [Dongia sp.]|uniref:hypothetical protein n=1 Tax=Dongia sp. TaxID=1977262 RepID=UPI0035B1B6CE
MGVQLRQTSRKLVSKGMVATMMRGAAVPLRARSKSRVGNPVGNVPDTALMTKSVSDLADLYLQVAERLLDVIHDQPHNLRAARTLSDHLEWVGARASLLRSFIEAGDEAVSYICASDEAANRLVSLVKLAKDKLREPGRLSVVLHLLERIDEELRLI